MMMQELAIVTMDYLDDRLVSQSNNPTFVFTLQRPVWDCPVTSPSRSNRCQRTG